jgi:uncharacterized delta-60 repeat protein
MNPAFRYSVAIVTGSLLFIELHAAPGDVELNFNPHPNLSVGGMALQPDGKIVITGAFATVGDTARVGLARIHPNGTLETSFDSPGLVSGGNDVALEPGGKMVISGIGTWNTPGVGVGYWYQLARAHPDGSIDTSFNASGPITNVPNYGSRGVARQPDGAFLFWGDFTKWWYTDTTGVGPTRNRIARTDSNANLDLSFDPNVEFPGFGSIPGVYCTALQKDGKILIGGVFSKVGGVTRNYVARLHPSGALDTDFNPGWTGTGVNTIAVQSDGMILVGGVASGAANLQRLAANGSLDPLFNPGVSGMVRGIVVQTNGRILVGGDFSFVGGVGRRRLARIHDTGALDTSFVPATWNYVYGLTLQADGKVLVNGSTTSVSGLGRVDNDGATQNVTTDGATRVEWLRGGASPEVYHVTFELSTDRGVTWAPLGTGTRMSGGWELTGLALPASGHIRAQGHIFDAHMSAIYQTFTAFPSADLDSDGLLDSWELDHWPTIAGQGPMDDSDRDGSPELLEEAFGLHPLLSDSENLPQPVLEGGYITITLTKQPGVTYEVQTAGTLLTGQPASFSPATTTVLLDNATTLKVRDNVSIGTPPARFMRVKVIAAP